MGNRSADTQAIPTGNRNAAPADERLRSTSASPRSGARVRASATKTTAPATAMSNGPSNARAGSGGPGGSAGTDRVNARGSSGRPRFGVMRTDESRARAGARMAPISAATTPASAVSPAARNRLRRSAVADTTAAAAAAAPAPTATYASARAQIGG